MKLTICNVVFVSFIGVGCGRASANPQDSSLTKTRDVRESECSYYSHSLRILAGQLNIVDCQSATPENSQSQEAMRQCVLGAWQAQRPFWGRYQWFEQNNRLVTHVIMGRQVPGGFQCLDVESKTSTLDGTFEIVRTSYRAVSPILVQREVGVGVNGPVFISELNCAPDAPGMPPNVPLDYDPPRVVPLGVVCHVENSHATLMDGGSVLTEAGQMDVQSMDGAVSDSGRTDATMLLNDASLDAGVH